MAYTKPQQRKEEESERLRGDREVRSSLSILDLKDGKSNVQPVPCASISLKEKGDDRSYIIHSHLA